MSLAGKSLFKAWKEELLRANDDTKIQTILLQVKDLCTSLPTPDSLRARLLSL